jgi:hypothetical protein
LNEIKSEDLSLEKLERIADVLKVVLDNARFKVPYDIWQEMYKLMLRAIRKYRKEITYHSFVDKIRNTLLDCTTIKSSTKMEMVKELEGPGKRITIASGNEDFERRLQELYRSQNGIDFYTSFLPFMEDRIAQLNSMAREMLKLSHSVFHEEHSSEIIWPAQKRVVLELTCQNDPRTESNKLEWEGVEYRIATRTINGIITPVIVYYVSVEPQKN